MSAALRRGQVHRAAVVLLAVTLAVLCLGMLVAVPPAGATSTPSPSPTATWPVSVQVTRVTPAVLRPGDDLTVTATIRNDGAEAVTSPSAVLRISRVRPHTRADLEAWVSGGLSSRSTDAVAGIEGPLEPGASVQVDLTVPAADIRLADGADVWGPRGLVVDARAGSRVVGQQRTFLLWLPSDDVPATDVSVAVPVVGPPLAPTLPGTDAGAEQPPDGAATDGATGPETDGTGDADAAPSPSSSPAAAVSPPDASSVARLEDATATGERLAQLARLLDEAPAVSAVVDPALLAQSALAGPRARQWSHQVTQVLAERDVLSLPWSDPDVAAVAHGARPDLAAAAGAAARSWAEQSGTGDVPVVLWGTGTRTPDEATIGLATNAGAAAFVLPTRDPDDDDDATAARTQVRAAGTTVAALAPDAVLTHLLTDPRSVEPDASPATAVQRTLAELAVATRQESDPPDVLLAPDREWIPDVAYTTTLLRALEDAPWVRMRPASSLLDGMAQTRTTASDSASDAAEMPPAQVQVLAAARERTLAFAEVTSEPEALLTGVDQEVLAPLSVAWRADRTGRDALVAAVVADLDARTSGLTIVQPPTANIFGSSTDARMTVRNALAVPVTVQLVVAPGKPCLEAQPVEPVEVDARDERSVVVRFVAHANCEVRVLAHLETVDGAPVSAPVEFSARVQPTIEDVGTVVVGVLLLVGLVLGIVRTVRRGQSARRGARLEAESDAPTALGVLGGVADTGGATDDDGATDHGRAPDDGDRAGQGPPPVGTPPGPPRREDPS
ncbi:DUF6049 family protein [Cellulomonas algicola]|uniref:DUF6049 family protein n=1 Tax=Cellulomonas algicola TaxID=2071633 RepID=UPI001C3F6BA7|nr:DUF6049 family protein [Cellulomonas algicola]